MLISLKNCKREILKHSEEVSTGFDETLTNAIIDVQVPALQKPLSSDNVETTKDIQKK